MSIHKIKMLIGNVENKFHFEMCQRKKVLLSKDDSAIKRPRAFLLFLLQTQI